jgi:hypothetical protein
MYTPYVAADEYAEMGFNVIPAEDRTKMLTEASRQVDTLTFNRIVAKGFDKLTEFQQDIVKQVVCDQAEFLFENADAIASVLDSYSINGVSMHFGTGFNVIVEGGLPIQSTTYSLLKQTGLCCRLAR